jgi:UDP-N-acetylglucosamine--N-acetylmuramyl-(pentapeptide) pyrophosphoryl-undecaprenol N-acetylglucosamine transferase
LAVAAEILERDPASRIVFVGSERPLEKTMIAGAGYEHYALPVEPPRALLHRPFRFIWRYWRGHRMAEALIRQAEPDAVIGLGGYASLLPVMAATRRGKSTAILEPNAIAGRATRFLSLRALPRAQGVVCAAFEGTAKQLPPGTRNVVTGNPVRSAIARLAKFNTTSDQSFPRTLLVLGGSQGAESLNEAVAEMLLRQLPAFKGWQVVHQTGVGQHQLISWKYEAAGFNHVVEPFFDNLAELYERATLVISRAGATTLAELACAGCPAILLPYPQAADNHQLANARIYETAGGAIVVEHDRSPSQTADQLSAAVAALSGDAARRQAMQNAMRKLARPDAAGNVLAVLQALIGGNKTEY